MLIKKENNQYYGKYFEQAINSIINGEKVINSTGYTFTIEEEQTMIKHAKEVANYLNGKESVYVGNKTSTESCDLLVDNRKIELKYVQSGTGTYFNTSIEYLKELGFKSYHEYLLENGYLLFLKRIFGDKVSLTNTSPVSRDYSSYIRNNHSNGYELIKQKEIKLREAYINDLFVYLKENKNIAYKFIYDMITKNTNGKKTIPDSIIIYNHKKEEIMEINKEYLTQLLDNNIIKLTGTSICFGKVRITFSWQNGVGLNNPTIRVFI